MRILSLRAKKTLFMFGCPNYENTLSRMAVGAALMTDEYTKREIVMLREWLISEHTQESYTKLYEEIRIEMRAFYSMKARCELVCRMARQRLRRFMKSGTALNDNESGV